MKIFLSYEMAEGNDLARQLSRVLGELGHRVFDPAMSFDVGSDVTSAISTAIRTSDVVVVLLTAPNSNLYYELGIAAGANVPTLIAARRSEDLVFDLPSAPYVQLTGDILMDAAVIARRVGEVAAVRSEPTHPELESAEATLARAARDPSALERLDPAQFERLVAELFESRGYAVSTAPRSADQGFDLILEGDPHTLVEVKRYRHDNLVSVSTVRQLLGVLTASGGERAILVSSSGFTQAAHAIAAEWPIELMTLEDLLHFPGAVAPEGPDQ